MFADVQKDIENQVFVGWAKAEGYQFLLKNDGDAEILHPDGQVVPVKGFKCQCGEHVYRAHCLHEIWLGQLRPCQMCGSVMEMIEHTSCFGQSIRIFECPSCNNARDFDLVRQERKSGAKDERMTLKGRCRQAIAWITAQESDWYVWQLVRQSPELIPVMVEQLSDVSEHVLADQIVESAGFKAA